MQIKTTVRYYFSPARVAVIEKKKKASTKYVSTDSEKQNLRFLRRVIMERGVEGKAKRDPAVPLLGRQLPWK